METNGYSQEESLLDPLTHHMNPEQLAAMADAAVSDQRDFESASNPSSPNSSKRKRAGPDSSPESRRAKRPTTTGPMGNDATDPTVYVESAVEAAQVAAAQASAQAADAHPDVNPDFSALQQATADHHEAGEHGDASTTAAAALGLYPSIHIPQLPVPTEVTFAQQQLAAQQQRNQSYHTNHSTTPEGLANGPSAGIPSSTGQAANKPAVGSEEWHKQRKDSHKEVERRRRETINEGINELAKIVPGNDKNKGSILQGAIHFIGELKAAENRSLEKWTLEKLLSEQAVQEVSSTNAKLKQELQRVYRELEVWKRLAESAGLQPPTKEEPTS